MTSQCSPAGARLETPDLHGGVVGAANDGVLGLAHVDAADGVVVPDHGDLAPDGRPAGLGVQVPDLDRHVRAAAHLEEEKVGHLFSCLTLLSISKKF